MRNSTMSQTMSYNMSHGASAPPMTHGMSAMPSVKSRHSHVSKSERRRRWMENKLNGTLCEGVLGLLSAITFALLIVEADYGETRPPIAVKGTVMCLSAIYALELALRIYAYRRRFFESRLNTMDLVLVIVDFWSWILDVLEVDVIINGGVLRGVRALRLTRTLQASGQCPQLHLMSRGLLNAVVAAFAGAGLMLAVLSIFSAMAVQIIHPINLRVAETGVYYNCPRCPHAFESVRSSLLTFFQQYVVGDSWGIIMLPVMEEAPYTAVFFSIVFVSVHFTIMNVIMAVIVDIALKASQEDLAEKIKAKEQEFKQAAEELNEICADMDKDGSGDLTEDEIMKGFETNAEFRAQLLAMDVKQDDMHIVFSIMDTDLSGAVNYEEFVQELFKMKRFDSHTLLLFIKHYVTEIRREVQEEVRTLKKDIAVGISDVRTRMNEPGNMFSPRTLEELEPHDPLEHLSTEFATLREHISQEIQQCVRDSTNQELAKRKSGKLVTHELAALRDHISQEIQNSVANAFPTVEGLPATPQNLSKGKLHLSEMSIREEEEEPECAEVWPPAVKGKAAASPKGPPPAARPAAPLPKSAWGRCCDAPARGK